MNAGERLYFTRDRSALVPTGHRAAAFLYAAEGDEIPDSAIEQFGLVPGSVSGTVVAKSGRKGEDKQGGKGEDKEPAPPKGVSTGPAKKAAAKKAPARTAGGLTIDKLDGKE